MLQSTESVVNTQQTAVFAMRTETPDIEEIENFTDDQLLTLWSYQFEYETLGHFIKVVVLYTFFVYLFFFSFLGLWCSFYSPTHHILMERGKPFVDYIIFRNIPFMVRHFPRY